MARAQNTAAAAAETPGATQDSLLADAAQAVTADADADGADDADDVLTVDPGQQQAAPVAIAQTSEEELAIVDITGEQDLLDVLNAEIDAKNAALAEIESSVAALTRDRLSLEAERDRLIEARDAAKPAHANQLEIMRHLAMQQRIREDRGEQIRKVREAGIDLSILMPQRPPVDAARMRPRPRQVPQRG